MSLLETKHLGVMFDGLRALEGVNFQLEENQIMGLIGPNGISKTTVFNLLTQVYQPMEGTIELEGKSIIDKKTYDMTRGGITRIFQNIRLFKDISILGNVRIAMSHQMKHSALAGILRLPSYWKEEHAMTERAMDLLSAFNLQEHAESKAKSLPYGQQRRFEIARTLVASPEILLSDEPTVSMNLTETCELMESIQLIHGRFSISTPLIEHNMSSVMGICQHLVVLDHDRIIMEGSAEEIRTNPKVITAYLGGE